MGIYLSILLPPTSVFRTYNDISPHSYILIPISETTTPNSQK